MLGEEPLIKSGFKAEKSKIRVENKPCITPMEHWSLKWTSEQSQ